MAKDLERICEVLDKLTLDSLTLMEQHIQQKLEVEKIMCDGESHLAKSRYIMGRNNVSSLQLPTENCFEFEATATVKREEDDGSITGEAFDLEIANKKTEQADPIRWFGVLVPQNLHFAQARFKQALLWAVKAANTQCQLREVCDKIEQLEDLKEELVSGKQQEK